MKKNSEKKADFTQSSSQTAVESLVSEKEKTRKKIKNSTGKGLSHNILSDASRAERKKYHNSEWFRNRDIWAEYIKKHREDLKFRKHVIDDSAPKLNIFNIYDPEMLRSLWRLLENAFEMNQNILRNIHCINILPGKTGTFTFKQSKVKTSNYNFRKQRAKYIDEENEVFLKMFMNAKSRLVTAKEHEKEWKKHETVMEQSSQFPLWWKVEKKKATVEIGPPVTFFKQHVTEKSAKYPDKRPRVFLEISIKNVGVIGRMVIMLFSDHVPMTVKNFLAFCNPKAELTYKGNFFYLIFQNYYCQTGDVVKNKGFGGTSIYGPYYSNEDSALTHGERGMLTTYQKIPNRNESQFLITFRKLKSFDRKNVVFGKIIQGMSTLDAIEGVGSKKKGRPKVEIYISDCGEI